MFHWFGPGMWGWGFLGMVIFWGGLLLVFVLAARALNIGFSPNDGNTHKSPKEILDERFAKGELSQKEYQDMKIELSK